MAKNMPHPKVFISFSSKDLGYVREIMSAFRSQNIDFWDYSDMIHEIERGTSIPDRLRAEIDACDYFLPLISSNSVDPDVGRYTYAEVEHALRTGMAGNGKIIPIVLSAIRPGKLLGPYAALEDICREEMDPDNVRSFLHSIARICHSLGVVYTPVIEAHPRLPFWKLFREEVVTFAHSNAAAHDHDRRVQPCIS